MQPLSDKAREHVVEPVARQLIDTVKTNSLLWPIPKPIWWKVPVP